MQNLMNEIAYLKERTSDSNFSRIQSLTETAIDRHRQMVDKAKANEAEYEEMQKY